MTEEIKEILKVDNQLLDKIENILGSELSNEEYDKFYNYFNEIRKPNILIDIKDISEVIKQIETINKELDWHKNNWEELKKYIKNFPGISYASSEKVDGERLSGKLIPVTKVLNKMKELEEDK